MSLRLFTMLTLTILNVQTLLGQITGNTNTRDPRAKQISHEYRDALCGKEWICLKLIEIRRGVRDEYDQHGRIVEFGPDGQFKCSPKYDGTWTIVDDQFIKISLSTFSKNVKPLLNGAYSIYALSDSTLVLGQILTSSGDFTREYTFTRSSTISASSRHPMVYKHPVDSLKEGKQIKHYSNGQVMSVEQLKLARKKITAEDLFLNYHKPFHDRYNAADSTMLRSVTHGEWSYYYPDGKIQAKNYYNEGTPIGRWVRFFPDGRLDETENYDDNGMLKFSDSYQYGKDKLWPIIKREARNKQVVFVIGGKDSVQFNQIAFYETGQADSYLEKKIDVKNLSARKVTIVIPHNALFDTKSNEVEVNPHDSILLNLRIKIPAGVTDDQIQIRSAEWMVDFSFHTFGYHLTNDDFDASIIRKLPSRFFFHRDSDDYELEIVKSTKVRFIALSKQMNMIELKRGTYKFTLIGPTGRKTMDVEISK